MIDGIRRQLPSQPSVSNSEIVVWDSREQMMKRVVAQTKRTQQFSQPIARHVGGIEKLIQMRNSFAFAVIPMRGERSNVVECQCENRKQEYLGKSGERHDSSQDQSQHHPSSKTSEQFPERIRARLSFRLQILLILKVNDQRTGMSQRPLSQGRV